VKNRKGEKPKGTVEQATKKPPLEGKGGGKGLVRNKQFIMGGGGGSGHS